MAPDGRFCLQISISWAYTFKCDEYKRVPAAWQLLLWLRLSTDLQLDN
jgi:hypothetical protein